MAFKRLVRGILECIITLFVVVLLRDHINLSVYLDVWNTFVFLSIGTIFLLNAAVVINLIYLLLFGRRVDIYSRKQSGITTTYELTVFGNRWVVWRDVTCILLPWLWFLPAWAFWDSVKMTWPMGAFFLICSWLFIRGYWNDFYELDNLLRPHWCSMELVEEDDIS